MIFRVLIIKLYAKVQVYACEAVRLGRYSLKFIHPDLQTTCIDVWSRRQILVVVLSKEKLAKLDVLDSPYYIMFIYYGILLFVHCMDIWSLQNRCRGTEESTGQQVAVTLPGWTINVTARLERGKFWAPGWHHASKIINGVRGIWSTDNWIKDKNNLSFFHDLVDNLLHNTFQVYAVIHCFILFYFKFILNWTTVCIYILLLYFVILVLDLSQQ